MGWERGVADDIRTALGVVGASEDPGGPGLVGGRLVALREELAALSALPALELQTRSGNGMMRGARESRSRRRRNLGEWYLRDVDGLVELAGADVLGRGVLVPGELDVAGRVALLRHSVLTAAAARTTTQRTATRAAEACVPPRSGKETRFAWLG